MSEALPFLETFLKAAELGSFTAAGKHFGLSQAAVSQRVQALEQSLQQPLFQRTQGRIQLTAAGKVLCPLAEKILALQDEARQAVTGVQAPLAGELNLAASSVPGEHLLPELLAQLRGRHPHLQVRVQVADTGVVLLAIEQGRAHLGLVGGKGLSPHLEYRCFGADSLALVVPAGHPLAGKKSVTLEQIAAEPLIVREPGSGSRWCLENGLARAKHSLGQLRVALELGSNEAIKEALQRGLGVAFLSRQTVARELASGVLHAVPVRGLDLDRDMYAVWDRRKPLPIPARLFLELLQPV